MTQPPWASGPGEILQDGLTRLNQDDDVNRRLAAITIDNAVELMMKTYLELPKDITGISLSKKEYDKISRSFPKLLDMLKQYAPDKLDRINPSEILWFHKIRNDLYHQGVGLKIGKEQVEDYAEIAKKLFENLFGFDVWTMESRWWQLAKPYGKAWIEFVQVLEAVSEKLLGARYVKHDIVRLLADQGKIDEKMMMELYLVLMDFNSINYGLLGGRRTYPSEEKTEKLIAITEQLKQLMPKGQQ